MAREVIQDGSARLTRAKRRIVTSCLECYRRKQKCDRTKPCNFCSTRGVPDLCRYDTSPHQVVQTSSTSRTSKANSVSTSHDSQSDLLDQVGYSSASRRDDFQCFGEYGPGNIVSDIARAQLVNIVGSDTYMSFVARLPSKEATAKLITAHFSADIWTLPLVDENHFRGLYKQFQACLAKTDSKDTVICLPSVLVAFPALVFSLLAMTLQFTSPNSDVATELKTNSCSEIDKLSQWYISTSQEIIDALEQQKPTTTTIQYYLIKMAWLKNCGRGNEAWQALGIAIRQAQEIDLHQVREDGVQAPGVSLRQTLIRLWEIEHRKRLWARLFIIDSHMAIALGRPRGINREDCSTQAPLDCDYPIDPSQTVPMATKHAHEPPSSFSPIMFSIVLGHRYHDLMSMRASKLDLKDDGKIRSLHQEVQLLLSDLPPALRPSLPYTAWDHQKPELSAIRQRLLTTTNIFLLALHRPYISTNEASRLAAIDAAFEILQSQQKLFGIVQEAQYKLYGYSFYTLDAGIFLAATVMKYPDLDQEIPERALQELQQAAIRLELMKERSPIAKTGEQVLRQCCAVLEARTPSPSSNSMGSLDGFGNGVFTMDATDFLQEFGSHIPDHETREFLSLLGNPTAFTNSSTTTNARVETFRGDPDLGTYPSAFDSDPTYTDLMSNDPLGWQS